MIARWTRRRVALAAVALAAVALALGGCRTTPPGPPNVLLIVLDTLRADRLGAYGNGRALTPFLDSLAARGTTFENAYAASSWTLPSMASVLTSRFPSQHGVTQLSSVLPESEVTLPEILREHGFVTGSWSANSTVGPAHGLGQGYTVSEAMLDVPLAEATARDLDGTGAIRVPPRADVVNRAALAWLDGVWRGDGPRRPVFLHLQYMEPHNPYTPPRDTLARLRGAAPYPDLTAVNGAVLVQPWIPMPLPDDLLGSIRDTYDAEVATLDGELRELFEALDARGVLTHAVVVVTADHGEELGDHGSLSHGTSLHEELVRVPLLVLAPGGRPGRRVTDVVSLVDVAPTILDACGIPAPPAFEGRSLAGLIEGRPSAAPGSAYMELLRAENERTRFAGAQHALVAGGRKLIAGPRDARTVYDLRLDPTEQRPLPAADAGALAAALEEAMARAQQRRAVAQTTPLDDATRDRLRALGYVEQR